MNIWFLGLFVSMGGMRIERTRKNVSGSVGLAEGSRFRPFGLPHNRNVSET
jgi:hypothetical protein